MRVAKNDLEPSLRLLAGYFSRAVVPFHGKWTPISVNRGTTDLGVKRRESSVSEVASFFKVV